MIITIEDVFNNNTFAYALQRQEKCVITITGTMFEITKFKEWFTKQVDNLNPKDFLTDRRIK